MPVKHNFVSAVSDVGIPAGWVKPSNWNEDHDLDGMLATLDAVAPAANKGIYLNGSGVAGLFALSDFVRSALGAETGPLFTAAIGAIGTDSPAFTGNPTAPTQLTSDNSTRLANTAFVKAALAALVGAAPATLDTLTELSDALGDDPNFATTMANALALKAPIASPSLTGDPTAPTPAVGDTDNSIATAAFVNANSASRGHISGLTLSTAGSSSTFTIGAGSARDTADTITMKLAASIAKTTAAWAVGAGGALDTGTIANSTWYYAYEIMRPDTGVVDACISASPSAPTFGSHIPAAYTKYRRVGAMLTNGSGQWVKFTQFGDEFLWDTPVQDVASAMSTTAALFNLPSVPTGFNVTALLQGLVSCASAGYAIITSPDQADSTPSATNFTTVVAAAETAIWNMHVRTNTARQIRGRSTVAAYTFWANVRGWIDNRGKD